MYKCIIYIYNIGNYPLTYTKRFLFNEKTDGVINLLSVFFFFCLIKLIRKKITRIIKENLKKIVTNLVIKSS